MSFILCCSIFLVTEISEDFFHCREWTDDTGKYTTSASIINITSTKILLCKKNNEVISVDICSLSESDKKYINTYIVFIRHSIKDTYSKYEDFLQNKYDQLVIEKRKKKNISTKSIQFLKKRISLVRQREIIPEIDILDSSIFLVGIPVANIKHLDTWSNDSIFQLSVVKIYNSYSMVVDGWYRSPYTESVGTIGLRQRMTSKEMIPLTYVRGIDVTQFKDGDEWITKQPFIVLKPAKINGNTVSVLHKVDISFIKEK